MASDPHRPGRDASLDPIPHEPGAQRGGPVPDDPAYRFGADRYARSGGLPHGEVGLGRSHDQGPVRGPAGDGSPSC